MSTSIEHNPAQHRFEIHVDGELGGFAQYAEHDRTRDFNHTVTYPQFRGQGLAEQVVRYALDSSRTDGYTIVATCPYVVKFIAEHPEYAEPAG
ncbi:GNAT family N-acetyltransferase [Skermania piniformis]|uniref:N-acetyltransferase n=1 Tax=Skermania pinensis TaxID=39122 RepID=A0ABX8SA20_9ACTN|nr:GNAT family N-acetyltransferase [Skermania piniformis]QXQ14709.1 N-acetyltransferase [Skermania piniformis]